MAAVAVERVEITSDINGIHHSSINGTTTGTGYGIDIGENSNVTGTSEADLLILQGVATTGTGTGIKLNGNNDLSNTSLNSSAVDGIALDITGPLANQGNVIQTARLLVRGLVRRSMVR